MAKKKSTKKALLASVLALTLSSSMLVGTTFAWFTDSVTSSNNVIQTGSLKVGMYYANGKENPASVTWKDAEQDAIFNSKKWEPGYVEARHIKVVNEGTLALKYKLLIVPNGEVEELADVIDVYFVENAQQITRESLANVTPVGTLRDLIEDKDGMAHGALLPNGETTTSVYERAGEVTATIALKMRESAGNEYQDKKIGTDFAIQLLATQYTYEADAFDKYYDKNAEYPVISADGLADALEEGKDVRFEADIKLTEAIEISGDVTVDLNGYDLDASQVANAFTVKNGDSASLTVDGTDEVISLNASGLVSVEAGADAVIEINGGNFVSDDAGSTLIKPDGDGEIKIVLNDVNYTSTATNGYALDCSYYDGDKITVEINGGNYEATTGLLLPEGSTMKGATVTAHNTKNMQPAVYAMGDMTIENCIIKADKSHAVAVAGGATVTLNHCEVYAGSDAGALAFQVFSSGGTINVNNTTYTGGYGTTGKMKSGCVAIINIDGVEKYRKG